MEGDFTREPTIFHITHPKAGSQWIHHLFAHLNRPRLVRPDSDHHQFFERPIERGRIYPTLYLTKEQFDSVPKPANSRRFVIIRDLRDTLVSVYFSLRYSHPESNEVHHWRPRLEALSPEDGFLCVMESWLYGPAQIQWSWIAAREQFVRYEDLLERDLDLLGQLLINRCGLRVEPERFRAAVEATRFSALASGRKRGIEDATAHVRKGIAGDWKNHFTEKVKAAFKHQFGSLLIAAGYEKDFSW